MFEEAQSYTLAQLGQLSLKEEQKQAIHAIYVLLCSCLLEECMFPDTAFHV